MWEKGGTEGKYGYVISAMAKATKLNYGQDLLYMHKTLVLYECQTWSLILKEEHRLRAFRNSAKRKVFGPNRKEVTADRGKKLHNNYLHGLYYTPTVIGMIMLWRMMGRARGTHREGKFMRCFGVET
jgi:hypothetical protein